MVNVRSATIDDIAGMCSKLRAEDVEEAKIIAGSDIKAVLRASFYASNECYVALTDEKTACIFGCIPDGNGASFWMIFSADVQYLPPSFFRQSKVVLARLLDKYKRLHNYTNIKNKFILKWLKWLEFTIESPSAFGGLTIRKFWKER